MCVAVCVTLALYTCKRIHCKYSDTRAIIVIIPSDKWQTIRMNGYAIHGTILVVQLISLLPYVGFRSLQTEHLL